MQPTYYRVTFQRDGHPAAPMTVQAPCARSAARRACEISSAYSELAGARVEHVQRVDVEPYEDPTDWALDPEF